MAKKIYDIVPPKVKSSIKTHAKAKPRKPRKKEMPEVVAANIAPEAIVTPKAKEPEIITPEMMMKDFKIQPVTSVNEPVTTSAPKPTPVAPLDATSKPNPVLMLPANTHHHLKRHFIKWILVLLLVVILGGGGYLYLTLPKADIQIWPNTQLISTEGTIGLDTTLTVVDSEKMILPARVVELEKSDTQEFLPTANSASDTKASGTIVIYNNVNPVSTFSLKTGTHFLSDSGKYFVTLQKVAIPAATMVKGKLVPGSIAVKVQAEETGPDSNIKPAKFAIPKLSGTPYYYTIWGESSDPMTGGSTGNVKKVSKSDLTTAKDVLTKNLFSQAQDDLVKSLAPDEVLLDAVLTKTVISASADTKVDTITEKFNQTATVKIAGLVFKKSDLDVFSRGSLMSQLTEGKTLLEKSINVNYTPKTINVEKGNAVLDITTTAKEYQDVNQMNLVNLVSGKTSDQIKKSVNRIYNDEIAKMTINFWPFWVTKAPTNLDRITVQVLFE